MRISCRGSDTDGRWLFLCAYQGSPRKHPELRILTGFAEQVRQPPPRVHAGHADYARSVHADQTIDRGQSQDTGRLNNEKPISSHEMDARDAGSLLVFETGCD
jgi:hypothetical protein